ncbi:hypothetical protein [Ferruginibacter sp. SUN106]|uniref:hypothetical protein n=1 Tax=Ferruginibacter sp. SUN106 TaxID=2978348 RepID=UPI003D366B06
MKYSYCFYILFFALLTSCNNKKIDTNQYYEKYETGSIPGLNDFMTYTKEEEQMDSIQTSYQLQIDSLRNQDSLLRAGWHREFSSFNNNRSRVYLQSFTNNIPDSNDFNRHGSLPMQCNAGMEKDTLIINTGVGFFGGLGFIIKIYKDRYWAYYFEYTDDVKPYKLHLTDSAGASEVIVPCKYQYLVLDKKPDFKPGQKLTGFLTLTTQPYYHLAFGENFDSSYLTGKIYFTCVTKQTAHE